MSVEVRGGIQPQGVQKQISEVAVKRRNRVSPGSNRTRDAPLPSLRFVPQGQVPGEWVQVRSPFLIQDDPSLLSDFENIQL